MIAGSTLASRFIPTNIAGCVLWVDGDTGTGASWTDQSGSNNHLLQATGSKQPIIQSSVGNGHKAFRFDGIDDTMQAAFTLVQPETIFLVVRSVVIGAPSSDTLIDGVTNLSMFVGSDTTPQLQAYDGTSLVYAANAANKTFECLCITFNGASSNIRRKRASVASGNAGTSLNASGVSIGCAGGGGRPSNTDYAAVIVYNSALSASNIALVESYLTVRFAL
jgi:hypothetical protein